MKPIYDKTKNKIKNLWEAVSDLQGQLDAKTEQIKALQNSTDGAWQELNRPKSVLPDAKFIDVTKHYLVEFDAEGKVELDTNGQKKMSPLYSSDDVLTSAVWDEYSKIWRLRARKLLETVTMYVNWNYLPKFSIWVEGEEYIIRTARYIFTGGLMFNANTYDISKHAYICIPKITGSTGNMLDGTHVEPLINMGTMLMQPWTLQNSTAPSMIITGYLYEL